MLDVVDKKATKITNLREAHLLFNLKLKSSQCLILTQMFVFSYIPKLLNATAMTVRASVTILKQTMH